jgi:hypothetical protein
MFDASISHGVSVSYTIITIILAQQVIRVSWWLRRSKAIYTYDFGDSWEHSLVLEKRLPVDRNTAYPVCTDGQLACPLED